MKEVPKKQLPEISGGDAAGGGCVPYPGLPGEEPQYPQSPSFPYAPGPSIQDPYEK